MMGTLLLALLCQGDTEFFEKKIRPVLVERCYKCHSAESDAVKGGLRVDSREGLLRGGESGPAIVPGDPDKSPLIKALRYTDEVLQMPPKGRLAPEQLADFESWVRLGAPDPRIDAEARAKPAINWAEARQFWSFRPPAALPVPAGSNPIDHFILERLAEKGLKAAGPADKTTLIRRATFDLTGLPPTPQETEAFLADPSSDAFERVVDRLLASPDYGERWGRHWLDVVRYADTAGDSADYPVPQAHKYRDYVIAAFNKDKPYDQFVREQIAGDRLESGSEEERCEKIVATGFLAVARRFGEEPGADHHLTIDDTIDTMGKALLGLTLSCARCHDHKFDPIPSEDYYALYGILASTRYPYAGSDKQKYQKDFIPLLPREKAEEVLRPFEERMAALDAEAKPIEAEIAAAEKELSGQKPEAPSAGKRSLKDLRKALGDVQKRREELAKKRPAIDDAYAVAEGTPADARVQRKGNPRDLGAAVPRGFPQILGGARVASGSGRLELAGWLTDPSNPLAARVMANRIWQHHFGRGLVPTPNYFGKQGAPPTHPALLDWLAVEFVKSGWSVKSMHRIIMLSETYRRSSVGDAPVELYGKFPRRRLEAEEIRDALLAVSGGLDRSPGGAHPFPARDAWNFAKASPFYAVYETNRRSVYLMQQRLKRHPYLALFDGPDANASTAVRSLTTTSLQALYVINSPFVQEQATRLDARLREMVPSDRRGRIDVAHRLAFGRPATPGEMKAGDEFLNRIAPESGPKAWVTYLKVLLLSNEFVYVD